MEKRGSAISRSRPLDLTQSALKPWSLPGQAEEPKGPLRVGKMKLSFHGKPRLYVAIYACDGNRKYRWDLIAGPKTEKADPVPGLRYRVSYSPGQAWTYSEGQVTNVRTRYNMLVRILVAKIKDMGRLSTILKDIPVTQGDAGFNSGIWVARALASIAEDGRVVGTANLDWAEIEAKARGLVEKKTAQGRFLEANFDLPQPMWDLLENREVLP